MASASLPDPKVHPDPGHWPSAGEPAAEPGSSTRSDVLACLQVLDQVWPREAASPRAAEEHAQTLGRFRIVRELGRGGFGVVFLAEDPELGRKLALKVPRVEVLARGEAWRRFLREAQAASRLDHPNLVPLLETGAVGEVGYIASVYVEGPSLEAWLAGRPEPVPPRQAAFLMLALAQAIEHAHQRGILHRDLKPANVLLQPPADGSSAPSSASGPLPFLPRICDFGLAKLLEAEAEESRSIVAAGSPSYMAPEQAEGKRALIGRGTDVYGLGAILYQVLTGRPPFGGATTLETLRRVVAEEPAAPRRLRPGLPRDLETICLKCLAKRPDRRYPGAAALAADLQRFLDGLPTEARPPRPWERAWKWGRRRPALATLVLLGALSAAGAAAGLVVLQRTNAELARVLGQEQELVATYRIRQAQQAMTLGSFDQARELLARAGPARGAAGSGGFAWNYLDRQLRDRVLVLAGHAAPVRVLAGSPDGRAIASGDEAGEVRLWDPDTRASRVLEPAHGGMVHALCYSDDGRILASSARTSPGELFLWDVATGKFLGRAYHLGQTILGQWFSSDGATVIALNTVPFGHPHRLLVWDVAHLDAEPRIPDQAMLGKLGLIDPRVQAVAGLLDGEESCAALGRPGSSAPTRGLAFTGDGSLVVAGPGDGTFEVLATSGRGVAGEGRFESSGGIELLYSQNAITILRCRDHLERAAALARRPTLAAGLRVRGYFEGEAHLLPTGREAVIIPHRQGGLALVDGRTWQEKSSVGMDSPAQVFAIRVLPGGRAVAFGSDDGLVRLWRLDPLDASASLPTHAPKEAWDVAFSPDGRLLATSGDDGMIRLRDAETAAERPPLRGHPSLVCALAWSPDGRLLGSAGWDATVRTWDASGRAVAVLRGHTNHVRTVAFSPDGMTLASAGDDLAARLWDVPSGRALATLGGHDAVVGGLAFSPDRRTLATCSSDGRILLWDLATLRSRTLAVGPKVQKVAFSPDGRTLASVHLHAPPRLWDVATGQVRVLLLGHRDDANHLAFSPDGRTLATAGMDWTVRLWDAASGQELLCLAGHQARVNAVAFSPDGRTLASVDHQGSLRLWRASRTDESIAGR
jgi:WD40 repeat protein